MIYNGPLDAVKEVGNYSNKGGDWKEKWGNYE